MNWTAVRKLVNVAEAKGWNIDTFKALLDYELGDAPTRTRRSTGKRKPMSAEARAKISAAQKKRWSKTK